MSLWWVVLILVADGTCGQSDAPPSSSDDTGSGSGSSSGDYKVPPYAMVVFGVTIGLCAVGCVQFLKRKEEAKVARIAAGMQSAKLKQQQKTAARTQLQEQTAMWGVVPLLDSDVETPDTSSESEVDEGSVPVVKGDPPVDGNGDGEHFPEGRRVSREHSSTTSSGTPHLTVDRSALHRNADIFNEVQRIVHEASCTVGHGRGSRKTTLPTSPPMRHKARRNGYYPTVDDHVELHSLTRFSHLNGAVGRVVSVRDDSAAVVVDTKDGRKVVQFSNIREVIPSSASSSQHDGYPMVDITQSFPTMSKPPPSSTSMLNNDTVNAEKITAVRIPPSSVSHLDV